VFAMKRQKGRFVFVLLGGLLVGLLAGCGGSMTSTNGRGTGNSETPIAQAQHVELVGPINHRF
jgi:hypothetical protein